MRFLSKIVFINSAKIAFAEVSLDGNVHFIGTQGVGKSTILRAILFFYNADKQKLGISKEKKGFDDYYFPYQNSYIIAEVTTETGIFSILAFKTQGRVAFRFFDSPFERKHFIDADGKAFETWEKTRESFGKDVYYTKIINSYEDYRNIIYGNNKGLQAEFRKYSIIESKQYQNIPRTIQNVFLNSKLDAEFIKETIIKSLNEEDIKIDLTTYSQNHLRDFETNLNDIRKWTDINKQGENVVKRQADAVVDIYSAYKFQEKRKQELSRQLGWALNQMNKEEPKLKVNLEKETAKKQKLEEKGAELEKEHKTKQGKLQEEIIKFKAKLDEIKTKREHYASIGIEKIISRVQKKLSLEAEESSLVNEERILTSKFSEIREKYSALIKDIENQIKEFATNKQNEKNLLREAFIQFKEDCNKQYEQIADEIRTQNRSELQTAKSVAEERRNAVTGLKIKQAELKNKKYYDKEISDLKADLQLGELTAKDTNNEISRLTQVNKNTQKEWELEESRISENARNEIAKYEESQSQCQSQIVAINLKLENSKDSLYGWLNDKAPGWEKTIGKVIDEDNVLFKTGLNPQLLNKFDLSFYGIQVELDAINKSVKTVAEYEKEKAELDDVVRKSKETVNELTEKKEVELASLKKKFQAKIKENKELIQSHEYSLQQIKLKAEELRVNLNEYEKKATKEKQSELEKLESDLGKANNDLLESENKVKSIEGSINSLVESQKKEKEKKVSEASSKLNATFQEIDAEISRKTEELTKRKNEIANEQKKELADKGADTERLNQIRIKLAAVKEELNYIEANRDTVAEFNKDKRELFDKEDEYRNKKSIHEKQRESEEEKYLLSKGKLNEEIGEINYMIEKFTAILKKYETDKTAFNSFRNSEVYPSVEHSIEQFTGKDETDKSCYDIISDINISHTAITNRFIELQTAINKFTGNFQENNIFSFRIKFNERVEYFEFADLLKEFLEEDKISEYKKRVEERFSHIIRQIGKETGELISKEGEIQGVISEVNKDFFSRNFVTAIKSMELRTVESANRIVQLLILIRKFNEENAFGVGKPDLFSTDDQSNKNEKAVSLLKQLIKEMAVYKEKEITLSDSFELQFRIVENDNDTDWVEKLSNVGSDGTDILAKAMINIMLLNVFKERAAKKYKDEFRLHCMMDEIGKLHPTNVKGILRFANERNIFLINSSPTTYNATDYKYTYILSKDSKSITTAKRLVKKNPKAEGSVSSS